MTTEDRKGMSQETPKIANHPKLEEAMKGLPTVFRESTALLTLISDF